MSSARSSPRYGFEPLQTPAFERLDVLLGKYGEEGDKLVFKILRRGEHEASGEADLALRYDMTVPLARVAAAYGSQLPTPYKRYAIGPVWRADRPGRGRFREFTQCDLDTLGTHSVLADAEVICARTMCWPGWASPDSASCSTRGTCWPACWRCSASRPSWAPGC